MKTRYYKVTEKELQALIYTADTVEAIGTDDELVAEAEAAKRAIYAICNRNRVTPDNYQSKRKTLKFECLTLV